LAATVYSLGTWSLSGISVYIPCIKETMMMMMMMMIMMMMMTIIIIIIIIIIIVLKVDILCCLMDCRATVTT
jgi:hypothetical protein